jgi:hypothetical protein
MSIALRAKVKLRLRLTYRVLIFDLLNQSEGDMKAFDYICECSFMSKDNRFHRTSAISFVDGSVGMYQRRLVYLQSSIAIQGAGHEGLLWKGDILFTSIIWIAAANLLICSWINNTIHQWNDQELTEERHVSLRISECCFC